MFNQIPSPISPVSLGLETNLGGRCVFACDINKSAVDTYTTHFGAKHGVPLGDINVIDPMEIADFMILTAGFPCQSYCRQNLSAPGLRSENGQVFHNIIRLLQLKQPLGIILENVPNLLSVNGGEDFREIVTAVERCGYDCDWKVIDARRYVPQQRRRLYIVGVRRDLRREVVTEVVSEAVTEALTATLTETVTEADVGSQTTTTEAHSISESEMVLKIPLSNSGFSSITRFSSLTPLTVPHHHNNIIPWSSFLSSSIIDVPTVADVLEPSSEHTNAYRISLKLWTEILQNGDSEDRIRCRRLVNLNGYAKTLVSTYKSGKRCFSQFVPNESNIVAAGECGCGETEVPPRLFTPRECCRLMGFPESFHVPCLVTDVVATNEFYHHIGNAVIPQVVELIAALLLTTIEAATSSLQINVS